MKNRTSLFENRPLRRAFDFTAYFLLLLIVAAERPAIRIAACALLALALLAVVVLLVRAAKSHNDADATDCPGDPLARTFVPIGFLALALVQTPADNRIPGVVRRSGNRPPGLPQAAIAGSGDRDAPPLPTCHPLPKALSTGDGVPSADAGGRAPPTESGPQSARLPRTTGRARR